MHSPTLESSKKEIPFAGRTGSEVEKSPRAHPFVDRIPHGNDMSLQCSLLLRTCGNIIVVSLLRSGRTSLGFATRPRDSRVSGTPKFSMVKPSHFMDVESFACKRHENAGITTRL